MFDEAAKKQPEHSGDCCVEPVSALCGPFHGDQDVAFVYHRVSRGLLAGKIDKRRCLIAQPKKKVLMETPHPPFFLFSVEPRVEELCVFSAGSRTSVVSMKSIFAEGIRPGRKVDKGLGPLRLNGHVSHHSAYSLQGMSIICIIKTD